LQDESVITRVIRTAAGVFAPGHLGELTQQVDFALVDAVLAETGTRECRLRLLPARVVVYFVLALGLFERCSYQAVWGKLTVGLAGLPLAVPAVSSLARARRRVGPAPLRRLFEVLAGPAGLPGQPGVFYRGLRTVAVDGTCLHVPAGDMITWRYPIRKGRPGVEMGYPLLRLVTLAECGTRAVLAAAFGPDSDGELHYASQLLPALDAGMLLLADVAFDAALFLRGITGTGAQFLVRSGAGRVPTPLRHLPDGSYLARWGYGVLEDLLLVRVAEAAITVTLADGTTRTEQWRLVTSLLDPARYPAAELVHLYHQRWEIETAFYSVKATMLEGRVLRSRSLPGIEQETWALLALYQALIRAAADTAATCPGLDTDQISFTVLLHTAADLAVTARNILPAGPPDLAGDIGRAALRHLLPAWRRPRLKARTRKRSTSKYGPNAGQHPATTQAYTFTAQITFFTTGLAPRPHR
jgi:hypothetical protein